MTESKAEGASRNESSGPSRSSALSPQRSSSSENYSRSNRTDNERQVTSNSHRSYNQSQGSNRRTYASRYAMPNPRSRISNKPLYQMAFSAKRTKTIYELDGQQKYIFQRGGYFENLRCPPCVLNNLSQTYKHRGIPWWDGVVNYRQQNSHYEGLHLELEHFFSTIKPYTEDEVLRKATFYCISKSIKKSKLFEIDSVKYYGSYSSNTYLPVSDIDLVVFCNRSYNIVEVLYEIASLLFIDGIIEKNCSVIPHSRIPLLKFYDSLTGFLINITVNTPHVMERADFIRESIKKSPHMIKILYFLKYYLIFKGKNNVFHGGIGSYSLALMVIRFFQMETTQEMIQTYEGNQRPTVLGRLLIDFLQFYSNQDFVKRFYISVRDDGKFIAAPSTEETYSSTFFGKKISLLKIEDHIEPWKNVSSGSFDSDLILADFGSLANILLNPEQCPNDTQVSILGNAIAVVDSFVDYRQILGHIYKEWFPIHPGMRNFSGEKYDQFILNRNVFGKRYIDFEYKPLDDNTTEIILKDKHESVRHLSQKNYIPRPLFDVLSPSFSGFLATSSYPILNITGRQQDDRNGPHIRQHYPSDSGSSDTNESCSTRESANHKKIWRSDHSSLSMSSRVESKRSSRFVQVDRFSQSKQVYDAKNHYGQKKYRHGQSIVECDDCSGKCKEEHKAVFEFGDFNRSHNSHPDTRKDVQIVTPKKQFNTPMGPKQKNGIENENRSSKQKCRQKQPKKSNHKADLPTADSVQASPLSTQGLSNDLDSESKALEIKKMLNIDSQS